MATLINREKLQKHSVTPYSFKSFEGKSSMQSDSAGSSFVSSLQQQEEDHLNDEEMSPQEQYSEENNPSRRASDIDSSSLTTSSKDALIESLMKKTDEMSSNFIKLQMKLEDKEQEYAQNLEKTKEESYKQGFEEGMKKASEDIDFSVKAGLEQFATSVKTLETTTQEYTQALENIKEDLISAAIDIAKEVVDVEVGTNSIEIAKVLSDAMIKELQSASKITLKVNPADHGGLSEHIGSLENVQIVSDSAVSPGGVIANSEVGNIDSQIHERFEKVKRAALSE